MEGQNYIDTTIKVIIDVIAKITNQSSPTGNVHPTKHAIKANTKKAAAEIAKDTVAQKTQDMKNVTDDGIKKATGFLQNL
jgi:hypothetical protein